ncbi:MAG: DUF2637 domain-containing protein [Pseudonocardiaceae bacterium]
MSAGQVPPVPPVSAGVRVTTVAAVVVVAVVAAVVSFSHLQDVAARAGEGWRSWLIPGSVDGLIVAASMVLLVRRRAGLPGGWLAWAALLGGVAASLACNIAAAEPTVTARLIAAWPPLAFAAAFELLLQQRRTTAPDRAGLADRSGTGRPPAVPVAVTATPVTSPVGHSPGPAGPPSRPGAEPVQPVQPAGPVRTGPAPGQRRAFVPAVRSAGTGTPARTTDRPSDPTRPGTTDRSPDRSAGRTGEPWTDAQLCRAVRELAEANGGSPPSRYQLKQRFGIGSGRAARLLAELGAVTAPGSAESNGATTARPEREGAR